MQMHARVLVGNMRDFTSRKGETVAKTSVKVIDLGPECGSDAPIYWVDFLGDSALSQTELDSVVGSEFTIDIKYQSASLSKDGNRVFLNMNGGAIVSADGRVVQSSLNRKRAS